MLIMILPIFHFCFSCANSTDQEINQASTEASQKSIEILNNEDFSKLNFLEDELKEEIQNIEKDISNSQHLCEGEYKEVSAIDKFLNILKLSTDILLFSPIVCAIELLDYLKDKMTSKEHQSPVLAYFNFKNILRYISYAKATKTYLMLDYLNYKLVGAIDLQELKELYDLENHKFIDKKEIIEDILNKSLKGCLEEV